MHNNKKILKAVIFDMDGLLFDTESLLVKFWHEAGMKYGYNITPEHVISIRSLARVKAIPVFQGYFGSGFDYEAVRNERIRLMNEYINEYGLAKKKGVDDILRFLKSNNVKMALATATDSKRTPLYLKKAGMYEYFDEIICGDMVKIGKPEPDIYRLAVKTLGLEADECMALEDSPNGLISAKRAGCIPVMVPDLSEPDEELLSCIYAREDSLIDVISLIKKDFILS